MGVKRDHRRCPHHAGAIAAGEAAELGALALSFVSEWEGCRRPCQLVACKPAMKEPKKLGISQEIPISLGPRGSETDPGGSEQLLPSSDGRPPWVGEDTPAHLPTSNFRTAYAEHVPAGIAAAQAGGQASRGVVSASRSDCRKHKTAIGTQKHVSEPHNPDFGDNLQ